MRFLQGRRPSPRVTAFQFQASLKKKNNNNLLLKIQTVFISIQEYR